MKRTTSFYLSLLICVLLAVVAPAALGQNYADAGWVDGSDQYPLPEIDGQIDAIWEVQEVYELLPEDGLY